MKIIKKIVTIVIFIFFVFVVLNILPKKDYESDTLNVWLKANNNDRPLVIAHGGGQSENPGDTMSAFQYSFDFEIEFDIPEGFIKDNIIEDVKFQTMGCAAAIATSSMATVLAKGKTTRLPS